MSVKDIMDKMAAEKLQKEKNAIAQREGKTVDHEQENDIGATVTTLHSAKAPSPMKPKKTSEDEVLFRSHKSRMGFFYKGARNEFIQHYYLTNNTEIIEYLKKNFVPHFMVVEE